MAVWVLQEEEFFLLMLESGTELKVPKEAWEETIDEVISRLPLKVTLSINGDVITFPTDLVEVSNGFYLFLLIYTFRKHFNNNNL